MKLIRYDKKNSKTLPFINSVGILFGFSLPEGLNRQIKDDELNQINNTVAKMFGNKGPRSIPINFDAGKNDFQSFGLIFKSKKEINDVLCNLYFNLGEKEISKPFNSEIEHNFKTKEATLFWNIPASSLNSIRSSFGNIYENFDPEVIDNKFKITLSVNFKNYEIGAEKFEFLLNSKPFRTTNITKKLKALI